MSDITVPQGQPWTTIKFFSTFEEADNLRKSLKTSDLSGFLQIKIKRCGVAGTLYVVKTRQTAEMVATAISLEDSSSETKIKKIRKKKV